MTRRAVVLANGSLDDAPILIERLAGWHGAKVVAADGGARHAAALGLAISAIVGDLDSLDAQTRRELEQTGTPFEISPSQKDETDLELALLFAAQEGAEEIAVIGAVGGRLDMTLANLLLLLHPGLAGIRVEVWHGAQIAWLIRPPGDEIDGEVGDTLSLIPLGGDAQGVASEGLAYPLRGETLALGPARGVSNVLAAARARVRLTGGALLAVHSPGRA